MKTQRKVIDRSKVRVTTAPNGINFYVTDTNPSRRCTASILNVGGNGWNVRIDRAGEVWKYLANIKTQTPEAAYEYCLEFGSKVEA